MRLVFIDIRDVTPHVLDEISLAWEVFGVRRTVFIVDDTRAESEWRQQIQQQLATDAGDLRLLVWKADPATFIPQVKDILVRVPEGLPVVTQEALSFVHDKVGEDQWDVRPMDQPWVLVVVQQSALAVFCGLLWLIHPWVMQIALGLFGLEGLSLYRQAWCRARRQREHAKQINPDGPPSAARLWGSLALMLGALSTPFVVMLAASLFMLKSGPEHIVSAKIELTKSEVQRLKMALMSYEIRSGMEPPTTEQGLQSLVEKPTMEPVPHRWTQYLESLPLDPWSRPYRYESPPRRSKRDRFDLWSLGPDGIDGTADDIGNFAAP